MNKLNDMPLLAVFDDRGYDPHWPVRHRTAVRCIIRESGLVAMVKSQVRGFYQFPGGGLEPGEDYLDALIREVREEVGLTILPDSVCPFGFTREIRSSRYDRSTVFDQTSRYYFATHTGPVLPPMLDDYERDLGYELEWVAPETAYQVNVDLAAHYNRKSKFVLREAYVLATLMGIKPPALDNLSST